MLILFSINLAKLEICLISQSARCVLILEHKEYNELMDGTDVLKYSLCPKITVTMVFMPVKFF
jgi:hypothetical protein